MDKTWKVAALALPAALGLVVSAYATPTRQLRKPPTTTVATTVAAATTAPPVTTTDQAAATTTTDAVATTDTAAATTAAVTTSDAVTTTAAVQPVPVTGTVQSPVNGTWYTRGSTVHFQVTGATSSCVVQWGDGAVSTSASGTCSCNSSCACGAAHVYLTAGTYAITFTGTSQYGTPVTATVTIHVI